MLDSILTLMSTESWRSVYPPLPVAALTSLAHSPAVPWSYENKLILAPMVRINTLPMRLLARHYGADIVYSEEIIACKLKRCNRVENSKLGTIEFTPSGSSQYPVFITYPNEPIAIQLGTANANDALEAASLVANDVRAIDINMGCPKHFSLQGGMGAALLLRPELVQEILTTLKRNFNVPITCKIRLLESEASTVEILRRAEMAGVSAIGVHARFPADRPRHKAMKERIKQLTNVVNVPLLYNGDVFTREEIHTSRSITGCSSLLLARGAMWNPSIFSPVVRPLFSVAHSYLNYAEFYHQGIPNSKFTLLEMLKSHIGSYKAFQPFIASKNFHQMRSLLEELENETREKQANSLLYGPYHPPVVHYEERPVMAPDEQANNQETLQVIQTNGIRSRKQQRAERKKLQKEKRKSRKVTAEEEGNKKNEEENENTEVNE